MEVIKLAMHGKYARAYISHSNKKHKKGGGGMKMSKFKKLSKNAKAASKKGATKSKVFGKKAKSDNDGDE